MPAVLAESKQLGEPDHWRDVDGLRALMCTLHYQLRGSAVIFFFSPLRCCNRASTTVQSTMDVQADFGTR